MQGQPQRDTQTIGPELAGMTAERCPPMERRSRPRIPVRWTVYIRRRGLPRMVEAETRDISTRGLYCVSGEVFQPGEMLDCTLEVPTYQPGSLDAVMYLVFTAKVLRAEPVRTQEWGIGCVFDNYSVSILRSPEEAPYPVPSPGSQL